MRILIYFTTWIVLCLTPITLLNTNAYQVMGGWWFVVCFLMGLFSGLVAEVIYRILKKLS